MQHKKFYRILNGLLALMLAASLCQTVQIRGLEKRAQRLAEEIRQADMALSGLPDLRI